MREDYCPPSQQTLPGGSSVGCDSATEPSIVMTEDPKPHEGWSIFKAKAVLLSGDTECDRNVCGHSVPIAPLQAFSLCSVCCSGQLRI